MTKEMIEKVIEEHKLELASTQKRLCLPIIDRIFKKMSAGIKFPPIKIENGFICDGHHRYVASILANYTPEQVEGNFHNQSNDTNLYSPIKSCCFSIA